MLVHVAARTQWSLLARLALRLEAAGEQIALSYEAFDLRSLDDFTVDVLAAATEVVDFEELAHAMQEEAQDRSPECSPRRAHVDRFPGNQKYRAFREYHQARLEVGRRIIQRVCPRALIVPEDGVSANCWLLKAASEHQIPILVCPYEDGGRRDLENALVQKRRDGDLILVEGDLGAEIRRRCPQWIKETPFGDALLFPPEFVLAREDLGLSLEDPWTVHGGHADRIAAESEAMLAHFRREGIPEKKLTLTGTIYCDIIHDVLLSDARYKTAFDSASKITPGESRILVSLPPSYHPDRSEEAEFETYEELCRETLGFLASLTNVRVTVSVHPATLPEHRKAIEASTSTISEAYIIDLIARHDIFVTCYSSTIRWAIACRKPVVNYDMYKFRTNNYLDAPGVVTLEKQAEFRDATQKLARDESHYSEVAGEQRAASHIWGRIDGQSFQRIHRLIRQMQRTTARGPTNPQFD